MKKIYLYILLICLSVPGFCIEDKGRTGSYKISNDGIDGAFYLDALQRMKVKADREYKAGEKINRVESGNKPSWQIYVPSSYDPSRPPGIMVYISPGPGAGIPGKYKAMMDKHNLIWVGANEAGNQIKSYSWRKAMSVAGVNRVKERYVVNPDRIFLSGMSGGGRTASDVAIIYSDLFKGTVYFCGVNEIPRAATSKMIKAAKNNHFVFLSGTKDYNLSGTKSVCSTYQRVKFLYTKLIVVEGLGHALPEADAFDDSLQFLDSLRKQQAEGFYNDALKAIKYKQTSKAYGLLKKASAGGHEEAVKLYIEHKKEFDGMAKEANAELENKNYMKAMSLFEKIVKVYGKDLAPEIYAKYFKLRKDKNVLTEIKLERYLLKIQVAIDKKSVSKEKITDALNNFIKKYAKSNAVQKAEKMLKALG